MLNDHLGQRLAPPPNAGYSTRRERAASDWMNDIVRDWERHPIPMLLAVCEGIEVWRKRVRREMRGMLVGSALDTAVDAVFYKLVEQAGPNPYQRLLDLIELRKKPHHQRALWMPR